MCSSVYVCVCETRQASVWIREPCRGVRQDAARGRKAPAAVGLVSASRKPSTMLHVRYPKVRPCGRILYAFYFYAGSGPKHRQRRLKPTRRGVSRAISFIGENSLKMLLRVGINATPKLTNLSMFRGEKKRASLKFLRSICITDK